MTYFKKVNRVKYVATCVWRLQLRSSYMRAATASAFCSSELHTVIAMFCVSERYTEKNE